MRVCSWEMRLRVDLREADRAARREEREDISEMLIVTEEAQSAICEQCCEQGGLLA